MSNYNRYNRSDSPANRNGHLDAFEDYLARSFHKVDLLDKSVTVCYLKYALGIFEFSPHEVLTYNFPLDHKVYNKSSGIFHPYQLPKSHKNYVPYKDGGYVMGMKGLIHETEGLRSASKAKLIEAFKARYQFGSKAPVKPTPYYNDEPDAVNSNDSSLLSNTGLLVVVLLLTCAAAILGSL